MRGVNAVRHRTQLRREGAFGGFSRRSPSPLPRTRLRPATHRQPLNQGGVPAPRHRRAMRVQLTNVHRQSEKSLRGHQGQEQVRMFGELQRHGWPARTAANRRRVPVPGGSRRRYRGGSLPGAALTGHSNRRTRAGLRCPVRGFPLRPGTAQYVLPGQVAVDAGSARAHGKQQHPGALVVNAASSKLPNGLARCVLRSSSLGRALWSRPMA